MLILMECQGYKEEPQGLNDVCIVNPWGRFFLNLLALGDEQWIERAPG